MVNPWHKTRRSVEKDYKYYDPPNVIWRKINCKMWPYHINQTSYWLRDIAYMCLIYASTCRASELCRFEKKNEDGDLLFFKPSVDTSQFEIQGDFLKFREVIVLKRREPVKDENGRQIYDAKTHKPVFKIIDDYNKYPTRNEINLPLKGDFKIFTGPVINYLETLSTGDELFPFKYRRGWQIVHYVTGEMQHYLRTMGLKFYTRLFDRNLEDLQDFSGHARIQNLMVYLGEGNVERKITEVRFNE